MVDALAQAAVDFDWIARNTDDILRRAQQHVILTVLPIVFGLAIAFPLALLAQRYPTLYRPLLGFTGLLFTIPSLALFILLIPFTGIGADSALIALTIYTLLVLLRNTVEGLRSVPREVRESAEAMGYRRAGLLFKVELPLALPVIVAGVRIATVTTIGLAAVAALIGYGGFGHFFIDGYLRAFNTPIYVGLIGCLGLALVADLSLLALQRRLTPWTKQRSA